MLDLEPQSPSPSLLPSSSTKTANSRDKSPDTSGSAVNGELQSIGKPNRIIASETYESNITRNLFTDVYLSFTFSLGFRAFARVRQVGLLG